MESLRRILWTEKSFLEVLRRVVNRHYRTILAFAEPFSWFFYTESFRVWNWEHFFFLRSKCVILSKLSNFVKNLIWMNKRDFYFWHNKHSEIRTTPRWVELDQARLLILSNRPYCDGIKYGDEIVLPPIITEKKRTVFGFVLFCFVLFCFFFHRKPYGFFTYILTSFLGLTVILHKNTVKPCKNKPFTMEITVKITINRKIYGKMLAIELPGIYP